MTYEETYALTQNSAFRGRVSVSCTKFATYITEEAPSVPSHPTRYRWAQNTLLAPDSAAGVVVPTVVWDPAVQADGAAVADAALQGAVENAVQKLI